jgi:imidazolonepropionase-like amidohydrolase
MIDEPTDDRSQAQRIVFTNANVLDGVRPAAARRCVVVEGDRIEAVSAEPTQPLRSTDRVVDLAGRTLMPGMATCHFHSTYHELGSTPLPYGSERPPAYMALQSHQNLLTALRWGYTTVVGAGAGQDVEPGVKQAIEDGLVPGPRFVPSGRELSTTAHGNDVVPWYWGMTASGAVRICDGPDEFRRGVREQVKRGAEVIKLFVTGGHGTPAPRDRIEMTRDELAAAIETAHERGVLIRGHLVNKTAIMWALELGIDIIDHCDDMDDEVIGACVDTGTYVVPSIYFPKVFAPMFPDNAHDLAHMYEILPKAEAAGVRLLLGDDYGAVMFPHGSYGGELHTYVEDAGIEPLTLLRWATLNGACLTRREHELGTIEVGKLADLLVVDGDPSRDIGALADTPPTAVIKSGEVVAGALPS